MNTTINTSQTVVVDGRGDDSLSWTRTSMTDEYKSLVGDGGAKVSVSVGEKVGAPQYSSVSLMCSVSMVCDQDTAVISKAQTAAFEECVAFIDAHVDVAYDMLEIHVNRLAE